MDLALESWVWVSNPAGMRASKLTLPLSNGSTQWFCGRSDREFALVVQKRQIQQDDQFIDHPGPEQGAELTYPKIYIIFKWVGYVKGPVLLIQSCSNSMRQGISSIAGHCSNEDTVLMVS